MMHLTQFPHTIALLLLALLVSGCGNKGDLYRPVDVVKKIESVDSEKDEE